MKKRRYILVFLTVLALPASLWFGVSMCYNYFEQMTESYSTLAEAQDAIERGWIPPILPPSTTKIHDTHNLDSNIGNGSFQIDPREITYLEAHGAKPYPTDLVAADPAKSRLLSQGFRFLLYSNEMSGWILAVHESGQGYFWYPPDRSWGYRLSASDAHLTTGTQR